MDEDTEMGGGMKDPTQDRKNGLISVNNLNYVLEPDLSVAVNVTHKDQAFQNTGYTIVSAPVRSICLLNTGADFIDMFHSFLTFDLQITTKRNDVPPEAVSKAPTHLSFGSGGSALNLISRLTIASRSGDELCRINQLNQWAAQEMTYKYDRDWYESVGSAFYANPALLDGNTNNEILIPLLAPPVVVNGQAVTTIPIAIPCYVLCGLFEYGRLLPSMLCSGLRIEIEWENKDRIAKLFNIQTPAVPQDEDHVPAIVQYVVNNPQFRLKSVQLTDSLQRTLNEQSSVNGLEIVYPDYETTTATIPPGGSGAHVEVRKACSRALRATARLRTVTTTLNAEWLVNSFESQLFGAAAVKALQWQLGSLYFPHQALNSAQNPSYAYAWALSQFQCLQPKDVHTTFPTVSRENYKVTDQTWAVCLERSTLFNLSGMPINNSRVLALNMDSAGANGATQQTNITLFLKYVKLARVFLLNIEVEQ